MERTSECETTRNPASAATAAPACHSGGPERSGVRWLAFAHGLGRATRGLADGVGVLAASGRTAGRATREVAAALWKRAKTLAQSHGEHEVFFTDDAPAAADGGAEGAAAAPPEAAPVSEGPAAAAPAADPAAAEPSRARRAAPRRRGPARDEQEER